MISADFKNRFDLITDDQVFDTKALEGVRAINSLLQKSYSSLKEKRVALEEITKIVTTSSFCPSFKREMRVLLRDEKERCNDLEKKIWNVFLNELNGGRGNEVRGDEIFSLFAISYFDSFYSSFFEYYPHLERITEKEVDAIYLEILAKYPQVLEAYIEEQVCHGRARDEVIAEASEDQKKIFARIEQDRAADVFIAGMIAQEIKCFPGLREICDKATSCLGWHRSRDILLDIIMLVRCMEGKEIPQSLEEGSLSFFHSVVRRTMVNEKEQLQKMGALLKTLPPKVREPYLFNFVEKWVEVEFVALLMRDADPKKSIEQWKFLYRESFVCDQRVDSSFKAAYEALTLSCVSSLAGVFKNLLRDTLEEFPEELRSILLDMSHLGDNSLWKLAFERGCNIILVGKNEISAAYKEGVSIDFFKNTFYSLFEQGCIGSLSVKKIFHALRFLKSKGCSQSEAESLLDLAKDVLSNPLAKVLGMSDERIKQFIAWVPDGESMVGDGTNFLLWFYGVPPSYVTKVDAYSDGQPVDLYLRESTIRLLSGMGEDELDAFFARFGALVPQLYLANLSQILHSPESKEFFFRVIEPSGLGSSLESQQCTIEAALAIYKALKDEDLPIGSLKLDQVVQFAAKLTPQESRRILSSFPKDSFGIQYFAESLGEFGSFIAPMSLHLVAREPFLRFFISMPWQQAIHWLEETITTEKGKEERYKTLSPKQKERLLEVFRFHPEVLAALAQRCELREEKHEPQAPHQDTNTPEIMSLMNTHLKDRNDPIDLLNQVLDQFVVDLYGVVLILLICAKEESTCSGTLLKWGNGSAATSLCSSEDSFPLFVRGEEKILPFYQSGFLNDPTHPLFAVTLRRDIIDYCTKNSQGLVNLVGALASEGDSSIPDSQCDEICHEIRRIAAHLQDAYPGLIMRENPEQLRTCFHVNLVPQEQLLPSLIPSQLPSSLFSYEELRACTGRFFNSSAFKDCERFVFLACLIREMFISMPNIASRLNPDNYAHQHALMFMTLLVLLRYAQVRETPGVVDVALSPFVRFRLKYPSSQSLEVLSEDNFGLPPEKLEDCLSHYSFHTLSPLTPTKFFSPQKFSSLAKQVRALSDRDFYLLLNSAVFLFDVQENEADYKSAYQHLKQWENSLKNIGLDLGLDGDGQALLAKITENYIGDLLEIVPPLREGVRIPFDRSGVGNYVPEEEVPDFIRFAGNFASALCTFMQPRDTRLHDGSCGVNSFLLGYCTQDLQDERLVPVVTLYNLVAQFRYSIVRYAAANQRRLTELFGETEVASLLRFYNDATQTEWSGSIVWECAAKFFKREIYIYSRPQDEGQPFFIGARGEVEPTLSFYSEREVSGPPIYLMLSGGHYYNLVRKK